MFITGERVTLANLYKLLELSSPVMSAFSGNLPQQKLWSDRSWFISFELFSATFVTNYTFRLASD